MRDGVILDMSIRVMNRYQTVLPDYENITFVLKRFTLSSAKNINVTKSNTKFELKEKIARLFLSKEG